MKKILVSILVFFVVADVALFITMPAKATPLIETSIVLVAQNKDGCRIYKAVWPDGIYTMTRYFVHCATGTVSELKR